MSNKWKGVKKWGRAKLENRVLTKFDGTNLEETIKKFKKVSKTIDKVGKVLKSIPKAVVRAVQIFGAVMNSICIATAVRQHRDTQRKIAGHREELDRVKAEIEGRKEDLAKMREEAKEEIKIGKPERKIK